MIIKRKAPAATGASPSKHRRYDPSHSNNSDTVTPLDRLMAKLDRIRQNGKGYTACCPAHDDRNASLSLSQADNGSVLMHCFAGCETAEILAAIGLQSCDLFPHRLRPETPEQRRAARRDAMQANWSAALNVLAAEVTVVHCACNTLKNGQPLTDDDTTRLHIAHNRIDAAREVLHVR